MKVTLTNGTELNPIMVTGESRYIQGASRDTLTFVFAGVSLDEMDSIFTAENCETISIINDEEEAIYNGYTLRAELVKKQVEVQKATTETDAVTEERVFVSMAQRTYAENQMAIMQAAMNALLTGKEV
ncbi:MAG: hypothetical protein IJN43_13685 [Ruminococcus sp.]|nr:hypothetical protein [Ruminococcus sp.]